MKQTIELHKRWKADPSKGEVFTPNELVREVCSKIPKSVWENPNSKFLDPCMGTGTILIEIVTHLIDTYGCSKEDAVSRVYGYDTRVKYVNRLKRGGFVNVFHKDFLNEKLNMKFDVVIGNPPYQSSTSETNSANALWVKFGDKVKDLINEGGYMAFIHPDSWVNFNESYINSNKGRMTTKLYRARVFGIIKPVFVWIGDDIRKKYFQHVNVDFSVVIGKKTTEKMSITLKHNSDVVVVDKLGKKIIPKTAKQEIINIFDKLFNNNDNFFNLLQNNQSSFVSDTRKWVHISKEQTNEHIFPLCNTSSQYNKGQYLWSTVPHEFQNISKVIFSDSGYSRPFYDKGVYGLSSHSFGIESNLENSEKIIFYLNSKTLKNILSYMGNSGAESQLSVIKNMIPMIDLDKINVGDEMSIVNNISLRYGLTINEKEFLSNG
jgi:hypothetical protein